MARKYVCEVCSKPIEEGHEGAVFKASVSFPPKNGMPQPTLHASADVCSSACLVTYIQQQFIPDLGRSHARWATFGVSAVTAVPFASRFPEAPGTARPLLPAPRPPKR
jgi:hypothetical protein